MQLREDETVTLLSMDAVEVLCGLAAGSPAGDFVEVGVYRGGSAAFLDQIATRQGRSLHLFDTFDGIPFSGEFDSHEIGDFGDVDFRDLQRKLPRAKFYRGIFPGTLPKHLTGIAFVHVDCDQYQSVKDCISYLYPRMVDGGIMLFDDYSELDSARKAVDECFFDGLYWTPQGKAFAVKGMTLRQGKAFDVKGMALR